MTTEKMEKLGIEPWNFADPQKYEYYSFEKVDGNYLRVWAREQLPTCGFICFAYMCFVLFGPLLMQNRKPFNLQKSLVAWNIFLALFSLIGAIRVMPEFFDILTGPNGFHNSLCAWVPMNYPTMFWGFAFTASKIAELIDTGFLVLRKRPVIFLHWFHHLNMVWSTFYGFGEGEPIARWVAVYNYSVHSVMYTYYALMAMKIRPPKVVPMMITLFQISQFVTGLIINIYTVVVLVNGGECFRTVNSFKLQFTFAFCYLFLFVKLFYQSYISKPKAKEA